MVYVEGPTDRVLLVGLGASKEITATTIREASAIAARRARGVGVPSAALFVAAEVLETVNAKAVSQAIAEGLPFGAWDFTELKRPPKDKKANLTRGSGPSHRFRDRRGAVVHSGSPDAPR